MTLTRVFAPEPSSGRSNRGLRWWRRLVAATLAIVVAATALTLSALPAQAAPPGRIVIGDSVTGMNPQALKARGFKVNYAVSRQFLELPRLIRSYGRKLPRNVVVHLGTNGTISLRDCKTAVRKATSKRTVFFVTIRVPASWERVNNATLRACDRSFKGKRVRIIDWHRLSDKRNHWFYRDGYHPVESTGAIAYAKLIDRAVDRHRKQSRV